MQDEAPSHKKLYIIIGIIVVLGTVFIAAYFYFRSHPDTSGTAGTTLPSGQNTPNTSAQGQNQQPVTTSVQRGKLNVIATEPTVGATINKEGKSVIYFNQATGHLFSNSFDGGKEERVSNVTIPAIQNVLWAPSKTYTLLQDYENDSLKNYYVKYASSTVQVSNSILKSSSNFVFSPVEDKILYSTTEHDVSALVIALPENKNPKSIVTTEIPDFILSWPSKTMISLQMKSSAFAPSSLYTVNATTGTITKLLQDRNGLDSLWSPDGSYLLFSETNKKTTVLYLLTAKTGDIKSFTFSTLPNEKCTWSQKQFDTVYCSIPQYINGVDLPDDWWQGKTAFNDSIWKINVAVGQATQLLEPSVFDITNMFISPNEDYVFFTNRKDGSLWSLHLSN